MKEGVRRRERTYERKREKEKKRELRKEEEKRIDRERQRERGTERERDRKRERGTGGKKRGFLFISLLQSSCTVLPLSPSPSLPPSISLNTVGI